jgi:predicted GNAT superfamily acetyltransferase
MSTVARSVDNPSLVGSAREAARRAEARAGVSIAPILTLEEIRAAAELWRRLWERRGEPPVGSDLLRALAHGGNYLAGAYADGRMVGALLGFFSGQDRPDQLHSHILGVEPLARSRGVGFALKVHQRMWALERNLKTVTWTFDPLVRANGYFNVTKLGARGVEYLVNFYGDMDDSINGGDETDRILLHWDLENPAVRSLAAGETAIVDLDPLIGRLSAGLDPNDLPGVPAGDADFVLCQTPVDIVALRQNDPRLAREWRMMVRAVVSGAMARGLRLSAMTRSGCYVLTRPPAGRG